MAAASAGGRHPRRVQRLLMCLVLAVPVVWGIRHGVLLMHADLASMSARDAVDRWARLSSHWSDAQAQQAEDELQLALSLTPDDAVLHDALAQLHTMRGLIVWDDPLARVRAFEHARRSQQASLALRPGSGVTWAALATSLWVTGENVTEVHAAWRQALRHAPQEVSVERVLFDLAFATWDDAAPDIRLWTMERWQRLPQHVRPGIRAIAQRQGRAALLD